MGMMLKDRGFLVYPDPMEEISEFHYIESFTKNLPNLIDRGYFRLNARTELQQLDIEKLLLFLKCGNEHAIERLFMLYCYFASAYIHSPGREEVKLLPKQIARPLVALANYLNRPPILSYASYCLNNWKRIDKSKPIELGNIELLQNFSNQAKRDEDWFILVHVDIEAKASVALNAIQKFRDFQYTLLEALQDVADSLKKMNATLVRMPENCSPEIYFSKVRPYIFGFNDVIYDGCFDNKLQTFRGETGAQSSIIPALINTLGIRHRASVLTDHLRDMKNYMPKEHVRFIDSLNSELRAYQPDIKDLYNECIDQVIAFRSKHFEYAVNYIEKKVSNPMGTGGTPYIPWLKQLIEETKEYYV